MAADDSYEIMPYKEIVELKKQIADLQRRSGDASSKELLQSMAALTKSMDNMLQLFSSAAEEMKIEEKTEGELSQKVTPLIEKVNRLEDQNKTIAEGLVAIASMVKDIRKGRFREQEEESRPAPPRLPEEPTFEGLSPFEEEQEQPELPPLEPPRRPMPPPRIPPRPMQPPRMMYPPREAMPPPWQMPQPGAPFGAPPEGPDLGPLPPLPPLEEEPEKKKGLFGLFKKK